MKTKAIKRCIDNGSDVRDALEAQVELYAIEAKINETEDIHKMTINQPPPVDRDLVIELSWKRGKYTHTN